MEERKVELLFLKVTHRWGQAELRFAACFKQVLRDRDIGQVEQFPEAIDHVDLLGIAIDSHANRLAEWHDLIGMKNMHAAALLTQLRGDPLHLGQIGCGLVADQNRDVGRGHAWRAAAERVVKGVDHILLARTNQRITMVLGVELIEKCSQANAARHRVDLGQRKAVLSHQ